MKKSGLLTTVLFAAAAFAQTPSPQTAPAAAKPSTPEVARTNAVAVKNAPTETDMYCSGFITKDAVPKSTYIVGGWHSPEQQNFGERNYIYLTGGSFQEGQKLEIVRELKDLNEYHPYKGQPKDVMAHGALYEELGRVRIVAVKGAIGIGFIEFSCNEMTLGDVAVPWPDRPVPQFHRPVEFDRFAAPNGKVTARIIAQDGTAMISAVPSKIYIGAGSDQGVKVGDYFRLTHTYQASKEDALDSLSEKASVRDMTQKNAPAIPKDIDSKLPRQSLGEAIVLYTTPTTSTAMITSSVDYTQVGDMAELMDPIPPLPPPPPPPMNPPTITCMANPASVHVGESSTIRCDGASPDDRPLTYSFTADAGAVAPRGDSMAVLDTANTHPGTISVIATVMDDRNLSNSATTKVTVEGAPAAEQASNAGEIAFKPNSAYVDNRAKAFLDGIALRLQGSPNSQALIVGGTAAGEAARLGILRANNAKTYLTREKGIDPARVQVREGGQSGRSAQIWFVPSGAAMPTTAVVPATSAPAKRSGSRKSSATPRPK